MSNSPPTPMIGSPSDPASTTELCPTISDPSTIALSGEDIPDDDAPPAPTLITDRKHKLPGPKAIVGPEYIELRYAIYQLIVSNNIQYALGKRTSVKPWTVLYDAAMSGVMSAYRKYENAEPHRKFKKFVLIGIAYDAQQYQNKISILQPTSPHEEIADKISKAMSMAHKASLGTEAKGIQRNEADTNESSETPDSPPTPFKVKNELIEITATGLTSALENEPPSNLVNSIFTPKVKIEEETMTAAATVRDVSVPAHEPRLGSRKKRLMDEQSKIDEIFKCYKEETARMMSMFQSIQQTISESIDSPQKNKHRRFADITANIQLLRNEVTFLKTEGIDSDDEEITEVEEMIGKLRKERHDCIM